MSWSATLAKVISRIMNPFSLSVVVLLLAAYGESSNLWALISWVLVILSFFVVLPLAYVYMRTSAAGSRAKRTGDLLTFFRQHPRDICVIGVVSTLASLLLLVFLKAPSLLVAVLVALLATSLGVALVNMFYRASYHLVAVTNLVIVVALV